MGSSTNHSVRTELISIYLVRDRINVSRAIAPKIDLDMQTSQSLCHFVRPLLVHDKLSPPLSEKLFRQKTVRANCLSFCQ